MLTRLRLFLRPPVFASDDETRSARLLNQILLVSLTLILFSYFTLIPSTSKTWGAVIITGLVVVVLASKVMLNRLHLQAAGMTFAFALWLILAASAYVSGGIKDPTYFALVGVIIMAGLTLKGRTGIVYALLSTAAGLVMVIAETRGLLPPPVIQVTPFGAWIAYAILFFIVAALVYVTTGSLNDALARARQNEEAQRAANLEMQVIRATLEEQVEQRTRDLEQRTRFLEASSEVSRAASSILDPDQLIRQTAEFIRAQFDLYYVGVFLTDRHGEWAELVAGTGAAGQAMLDRGHRIAVGKGMIGWSVANNRPRVSLEAGEDAVRLATPELPDTRSEAAIPLRSRGRILGAVSVQSVQPRAFTETMIAALQLMADQVAASLDNARLLAETQQALENTRRAYGEISRQAWETLLQGQMRPAFRYQTGSTQTAGTLEPIESDWSAEMQAALLSGRPVQSRNGAATLHLPIRVRDQVIGVLNFHKSGPPDQPEAWKKEPVSGPGSRTGIPGNQDGSAGWTESEIELLTSLSDQLGVALDSARLYQETQRQAMRARLTGDVTAQIRATLDVETVLQTAAREVRQALDLPEVTIHLVGPDALDTSPAPEVTANP